MAKKKKHAVILEAPTEETVTPTEADRRQRQARAAYNDLRRAVFVAQVLARVQS